MPPAPLGMIAGCIVDIPSKVFDNTKKRKFADIIVNMEGFLCLVFMEKQH